MRKTKGSVAAPLQKQQEADVMVKWWVTTPSREV